MLHQIDAWSQILINSMVGRSPFFDHFIYSVNNDFSLCGSLIYIFFGLVWYRRGEEDVKARILASLAATSVLTGLSVLIQSVIFVHARPMFDASLHLTMPYGINPETWRGIGHENSFPSDTTTFCVGMAFTIMQANRRMGIIALVWTAIVIAFPRTYLTYHYPLDLVGGYLLGACVLFMTRMRIFLGPAQWLIAKTLDRPQWLQAFLLAYLIETSTMFQTIRALLHMLQHHHH